MGTRKQGPPNSGAPERQDFCCGCCCLFLPHQLSALEHVFHFLAIGGHVLLLLGGRPQGWTTEGSAVDKDMFQDAPERTFRNSPCKGQMETFSRPQRGESPGGISVDASPQKSSEFYLAVLTGGLLTKGPRCCKLTHFSLSSAIPAGTGRKSILESCTSTP